MKKVQLGTVIHSLNTGLNPRKFFQLNTPNAEFYYVTIKEMVNGKIIYNENTDRLNTKALQLCNKRSNLEKGDVLFSGTGTIGKTVVLTETPTTWNIKEGVYTIKPKAELLDSRYLAYVLSSEPIKNIYMANVGGGTVKSLKMADLEKTEIPLPTLPEQQKIAAELDKIQSAIDNKKQQLSLLDEAVKSEFVEMFGEIDISPQRNDWTELKDITTIYTGTTPSTTDEENWNGDILWITPAEMTSESFYIYDTERKITEKGQKSKNLSLMPANTVLLSTRAPIGKVGIAGSPMTCNQGFKNFYCKEDVLNPVYLYFLFKLNTEYLNSKGTGTTFKELSKSAAEKIKVPIPPLDLQNQFAAFVQQIDKSKSLVKQQLADLQELLDSKMQEYFGA